MELFELKQIHEDDYTPYIKLDPDSGDCEISGDSYIDNAFSFYQPVISWFREYCSDMSRTLNFDIKLAYYNTSSTDCIFEILSIVKDFEDHGGTLNLKWYIVEDDLDLEAEIKDFEAYLNLNIETIKVEELKLHEQ